jgi:hypothetical protein
MKNHSSNQELVVVLVAGVLVFGYLIFRIVTQVCWCN